MENNTIIINLEPSGSQVVDRTSATYEEAFLGGGSESEEMSNAKGRGRARRKKRRLERIKNRREVRTERRKLKSDRQEERLARRRKRKQTRQEMRDEQQEARMERRNKRREDRENRRGNEPEGDEEDEDTLTTRDEGGYDERDEDAGSTSGSDEYADEDEDAGSDDYADEDEDYGSDEYADEDEEETSFDGVNYDFDGESDEFISEATGRTKVSPMVQEICMKIEWNNEMLMRLANKKKQMLAQGKDVSRVNSAIDEKFDRVQNLENKLENFAGADGKIDRKRAKEIRLAKKMARRKRLAMASDMIPPVLAEKLRKRGFTPEQISQWWATKGKRRFKKSNFEGEGETNIDDRVIITDEPVDTENWGMPPTEFDVDLGGGAGYDPMSFATGEKSSTSGNFWKSVLVGVVVGGVLIYVIRKYKLLKD